MKLYHCAPASARSSIQAYGLDPSRSVTRWSEGEPGVYAFADLDEARWYADYMGRLEPVEEFDVWVFTATAPIRPDSGLDSEQSPTTAAYHLEPVPAARVRRWRLCHE